MLVCDHWFINSFDSYHTCHSLNSFVNHRCCLSPKNGMTSPHVQPGASLVQVIWGWDCRWPCEKHMSIERLLAMSLYSFRYIHTTGNYIHHTLWTVMGHIFIILHHGTGHSFRLSCVATHESMFTHQLCFQCKRSGHYYILQPWLIVHTLDKRKTKGSMTIQQNWQKTTRCPKFRLDYHWGLLLSFSSLSLD